MLGLLFGLYLAWIFVGGASVAFSQEIQPVNDMADFILGVLTGRLATALAGIAVAVVGALACLADFPREAALRVVGGIVAIFGAVQIVAILESVVRG